MFRRLQIRFWQRRALNAFATADFARARQAFERLLALAPRQRGHRFNLGLVLLAEKDFAAARASFLEEQQLHGDSLPLAKALAETAYRTADRQQARTHYARCLGFEPTGKERAFCAQRLAICNDGQRFERAMAAQTLADRGDEMMGKKEFAAAAALFSESCSLDATHFQALNNLGAIRLAQKDYAGALESFRQADQLVDLPQIKKNLAYLARQQVAQ